MQLLECFPTPIWIKDDIQVDDNSILDFALSLQKESPDRRDANQYRESPTGLKWRSVYLDEKEIVLPALQKVIQITTEMAKQAFNTFNPHKSVSLHFYNCWFNLNDPGTYTGPHVHPSSSMLATYYIKAPPRCGNIVFMNPNQSVYWNFPSGAFSPRTSYTDGLKSIEAKQSRLIVAPAHLQHYVEPNDSGELRVSLTLNYIMKNKVTVGPNDRNFSKI
jgi:uncharacterized protein (TIGR02466 family)